ncbi:TetR/AcrR family transcriptional regulator [Methanobrevibacter sp.]|uniref:TetR/AcrR family transcriptional regulator n=1 Tax=Methanobrevibacter sp. TaxID=66852 RepID=UPI0038687EA6
MDLELDSTSEKIVSATFKLLQQDGSEKATTKKIAAEAGVNEVTIFRKFENKKNLIEITKEYYLQVLINTLEEIFVFDEDQTIEEYLKISFYGILNLSEEDFSILKVAMEEVRGVSEKKNLISEVTDVILNKLEEFFRFQVDNGIVREDINPKSLAIMCFSVLFQSVILWKIYDKDLGFETIPYADDIMNVLFEGINP